MDGWMDGWMNGWMDGWMDGVDHQGSECAHQSSTPSLHPFGPSHKATGKDPDEHTKRYRLQGDAAWQRFASRRAVNMDM